MIIKLVHLNILELSQAINMPYTIAQVIFSQVILDEVHIQILLSRLPLRNNNNLTELADDVPIIWESNLWIRLDFLFKVEVFMELTDFQWSNFVSLSSQFTFFFLLGSDFSMILIDLSSSESDHLLLFSQRLFFNLVIVSICLVIIQLIDFNILFITCSRSSCLLNLHLLLVTHTLFITNYYSNFSSLKYPSESELLLKISNIIWTKRRLKCNEKCNLY